MQGIYLGQTFPVACQGKARQGRQSRHKSRLPNNRANYFSVRHYLMRLGCQCLRDHRDASLVVQHKRKRKRGLCSPEVPRMILSYPVETSVRGVRFELPHMCTALPASGGPISFTWTSSVFPGFSSYLAWRVWLLFGIHVLCTGTHPS